TLPDVECNKLPIAHNPGSLNARPTLHNERPAQRVQSFSGPGPFGAPQRTHHQRVKVPPGPHFRPVTECNCVAEGMNTTMISWETCKRWIALRLYRRRGGEQQEVNSRSATKVNSIRPQGTTAPAEAVRRPKPPGSTATNLRRPRQSATLKKCVKARVG